MGITDDILAVFLNYKKAGRGGVSDVGSGVRIPLLGFCCSPNRLLVCSLNELLIRFVVVP